MSEPPEMPPVIAPVPYPQQSPFMQFASHSSTDSMATLNSKTSLPEATATAVSLQVCAKHIADRLRLPADVRWVNLYVLSRAVELY